MTPGSSTSTRRSRTPPVSGSPRSSRARARRASAPASGMRSSRSDRRAEARGSSGSSPPAAARSSTRAIAGGCTAAGRVVWLDGAPEALAQRLRHSPNPRPLLAGTRPDRGDPGAWRPPASGSTRSGTGSTGWRRSGRSSMPSMRSWRDPLGEGTTLLDAATPIGRIVLGDGIAGRRPRRAARAGSARARALVSEPGAWEAVGASLVSAPSRRPGCRSSSGCSRRARRRSGSASSSTRRAPWRSSGSSAREPLVAVGGGALGDSAGFLAAIYLRGIPLDPRPDDARRPARQLDRRQDRGRPARGQEPRRRLPSAGRGHRRRGVHSGRFPIASGERRSARP